MEHPDRSPAAMDETSPQSARRLPDDLPTSLDDRRTFDNYAGETEIYDAWQGSSQYITAPTPARPLNFDLHLDTPAYNEEDVQARLQDSDSRLMEMMAARAHHQEDVDTKEDEDSIANDDQLSSEAKREILQKSLNMAASNGDVSRVAKLVSGRARDHVDVNRPDEEGTVPLIYASCFGHLDVVKALLDAGASVDKQDRNQWSALMWAMTNRHKEIAKILLDHGANPDIRSSSGGTAHDFIQPGSELSNFLHENGYHFGGASTVDGDFYHAGVEDDRFEVELAESEVKRRMLMQESAANLEVDLSTLGFHEQPESPVTEDEEEDFIWERCVGDQMFVFQDDKMELILNTIITNMTPQRSPSQKPVPANLVFLMARYAHYHMTGSLLEDLLNRAMDLVNHVIERHQWDMTMLAFWISNATLLLHYLKKDAGLVQATSRYQLELAELINEIFILIIRDAERRMDKLLDVAMLDHETIPGLGDVEFQGEWKVFKSKPKVVDEPPDKRFRPPSPKRRAQTSPRNVTSLLSSTLFVLDLYDVHSVITAQILAQLLYWIGAELFNRVVTTRKYLSRTKAMQIRMNVSAIEDWARANNRQPEHYEHGSTTTTGETTVDAARRHLAPVVQLLQWLQCFSSTTDDHESLVGTLTQLQRLSPTQLVHAVKNYRYEVGEKGLPKIHTRFLQQLQKGQESLTRRPLTPVVGAGGEQPPTTPTRATAAATAAAPATTHPASSTDGSAPSTPNVPANPPTTDHDRPPRRDALTLDQSMMLPFSLPTSTDMLISYGAGIGGVNRERARKYIPTVPTEVLSKLNLDGDEPGSGPGPGPGPGSGQTARIGDPVGGRHGSVVSGGWRNGNDL